MKFVFKLIRNSLILGLGYFISMLPAFETYCWKEWQSLIIFVGTYVVAELMYQYKINPNPKRRNGVMLIF